MFFCSEPVPRRKRQLFDHEKNTCSLLLVADHRFFTHMGRGEENTTLNYLVSPNAPLPARRALRPINRLRCAFQIELIDRVDDIYRNTSWDDEFSGYGVQIQQVRGRSDGSLPRVSRCQTDVFLLQILIKNRPTPVPPGGSHFNMKGSPVDGKDVWDVKKLLEVKPDPESVLDQNLLWVSGTV